MSLQGFGVSITPPTGWSARIFNHAGDPDSDNRPTVHLASFRLPEDNADFGSGVIDAMSAADTFLALAEYTPDCYLPGPGAVRLDPSAGAFASVGVPVLRAADFSPHVVHGNTSPPNATAAQATFSVGGRPFTVYTVVGDTARLSASMKNLNTALATLSVTPVVFTEFTLPLGVSLTLPGSTNGLAAGTGTAKSLIWDQDGEHSQSVSSTLNLSIATQNRDMGAGQVTAMGPLAAVLPNGRAAKVNAKLVMPTGQQMGKLYVDDDPVGLPAAIDAADIVAGLLNKFNLTSTFVLPADRLIA